MSVFSDRLRSLRTNFGMSQQRLADELRIISKSSINMYERGEREPGLEAMEAFADYFNVDIDYLYGKSDIPNRSNLRLTSSEGSFSLTQHEKSLVLAYRSHPEMQDAVDRLLELPPAGSAQKDA